MRGTFQRRLGGKGFPWSPLSHEKKMSAPALGSLSSQTGKDEKATPAAATPDTIGERRGEVRQNRQVDVTIQALPSAVQAGRQLSTPRPVIAGR